MKSCCLLFVCISFKIAAQTFTDVTPANIPGVDRGDLAWADFNNDGFLDFAISGATENDSTFSAIYTGSGDGKFQVLVNNPDMPQMIDSDLSWGDFDNDGDLDLAIIGQTDDAPLGLTVILRNNITTFEAAFTTIGAKAGSLAWFDYNNDGYLDLYQVGGFPDTPHANSVFINLNGEFSENSVFDVKGYSTDISINNTACLATDFDKDGDQDIFSTGKYLKGSWSQASMLVNNSPNVLENIEKYRFTFDFLSTTSGSVSQGDFDRDGYIDYILTGDAAIANGMHVPFSRLIYGMAGGEFFNDQDLMNVYNSSTDVGDFDNNGLLDIIISGLSSDGPVTTVFLNSRDYLGQLTFLDAQLSNLKGLHFSAVSLGDFDNDGNIDILICGRDAANVKTTKLYRNEVAPREPALNQKPSPPDYLLASTENNAIVAYWGKGDDSETPPNALTYNLYLSKERLVPFKFFPEADVTTGERKVFAPGNASVNTQWSLEGLETGTYYVYVQTIDGNNEGSMFLETAPIKFLRIETDETSCWNSVQDFWVTPDPLDSDDGYEWNVIGGALISGQGSTHIKLRWDASLLQNPTVTVATSDLSNSYSPESISSPPECNIVGQDVFCDVGQEQSYQAGLSSNDLVYDWIIDGVKYDNTTYPDVVWSTPGVKQLEVYATDLITGCQAYSEMEVHVFLPIVAEVKQDGNVFSSATVDPSYSYTWEKSVDTSWLQVGTKETFTPTAVGQYRLTVSNPYSCSATVEFEVTAIVSGVEDLNDDLKIFPNPAQSSIEVSIPGEGTAIVNISDMTGRNIMSVSTTAGSKVINCSSLSPGVYIVNVALGDRMMYAKVVIEQ
jgi:hypothetical protein